MTRGGQRTLLGAALKQLQVPGDMYFPWIPTMSSGHDVSEYQLDSYQFEQKSKNKSKKIIFLIPQKNKKLLREVRLPTPEYQAICLFAGLLDNQDRADECSATSTAQLLIKRPR